MCVSVVRWHDGVHMQVFNEAIKAAWEYKTKGSDFIHEIMDLLDDDTLGADADGAAAKA